MAATQKINFLTLASYSLPNTFRGLSRTVSELYWVNLGITPLQTTVAKLLLLRDLSSRFVHITSSSFVFIISSLRFIRGGLVLCLA